MMSGRRRHSVGVVQRACRCHAARARVAAARAAALVVQQQRRRSAALIIQRMAIRALLKTSARSAGVRARPQPRAHPRLPQAISVIVGFARVVLARRAMQKARGAATAATAGRRWAGACVRVQSHVRGWLARRQVRPALAEQGCARAALMIQRQYRGHAAAREATLRRRCLVLTCAALRLQCAWRGRRARAARAVRLQAHLATTAAAAIQRAYRASAARVVLAEMKDVDVQAARREARWLRRRERSARMLQRMLRGHAGRVRARRLLLVVQRDETEFLANLSAFRLREEAAAMALDTVDADSAECWEGGEEAERRAAELRREILGDLRITLCPCDYACTGVCTCMHLHVGVHTGAAQAALEHARRSVLALTSADARLNGPCDLIGEEEKTCMAATEAPAAHQGTLESNACDDADDAVRRASGIAYVQMHAAVEAMLESGGKESGTARTASVPGALTGAAACETVTSQGINAIEPQNSASGAGMSCMAAAAKVQAVWKGHYARNRVRRFLQKLAAVRLQRLFRGHLGRRLLVAARLNAQFSAAKAAVPADKSKVKATPFQALRAKAAAGSASSMAMQKERGRLQVCGKASVADSAVASTHPAEPFVHPGGSSHSGQQVPCPHCPGVPPDPPAPSSVRQSWAPALSPCDFKRPDGQGREATDEAQGAALVLGCASLMGSPMRAGEGRVFHSSTEGLRLL